MAVERPVRRCHGGLVGGEVAWRESAMGGLRRGACMEGVVARTRLPLVLRKLPAISFLCPYLLEYLPAVTRMSHSGHQRVAAATAP